MIADVMMMNWPSVVCSICLLPIAQSGAGCLASRAYASDPKEKVFPAKRAGVLAVIGQACPMGRSVDDQWSFGAGGARAWKAEAKKSSLQMSWNNVVSAGRGSDWLKPPRPVTSTSWWSSSPEGFPKTPALACRVWTAGWRTSSKPVSGS